MVVSHAQHGIRRAVLRRDVPRNCQRQYAHETRRGASAQRELCFVRNASHRRSPSAPRLHWAPAPSRGPNMPYTVPSAVTSSLSMPAFFDVSLARKPVIVTTSPCLMTFGE